MCWLWLYLCKIYYFCMEYFFHTGQNGNLFFKSQFKGQLLCKVFSESLKQYLPYINNKHL